MYPKHTENDMQQLSSLTILDREIERLSSFLQEHHQDEALFVPAGSYYIIRSIDALFTYLSDVLAHEVGDEYEDMQQALQDARLLDEQSLMVVQELYEIYHYFLEVKHTDMDFIGQIVAYADTYMQAIRIVREKVQNESSINQVEDNG